MIFELLLIGLSLAGKQEFSIDVNVHMTKVGSLYASPDGTKVAFTAKVLDDNTQKRNSKLYLQYLSGGDPVCLMENEAFSVTDFAWGPDSETIAFLSSADAKSIFLYSIKSKTFETVASFPVSIGNLRWSKRGGIMTFSALVYPGMTMQESADFAIQRAKYGSDAIAYDRAPVYFWDHFVTGDANHLFFIKVNLETKKFGPDATDIMNKFEGDCPERTFGSKLSYDISENDKFITYSAQPEAVEPWSVRKHVYVYSIPENDDPKREAMCLTCGKSGMHTSPIFSPTGRFVAMLKSKDDYDESEYSKLLLYDLLTKEEKTYLENWDELPSSIHWSAHLPDKIIITTSSKGRGRVVSLDVGTGKIDSSNDAYSVSSCQMVSKKRMVYLKSTYTHPVDVWAGNLVKGEEGLEEVQLTNMNKEVMENLATPLIEPIEVFFDGALKEKGQVQGWYFPPKDRKEGDGKKYPLLVWIHGGPESSWEASWSDRWNPECMLMQSNFGMFLPNIHGSTGFGEEFTKAVRDNWSTHPLDDVVAGRKAILAKFDYLDPKKTAAMGGSFGGYMVNLIQSQDSTNNKEESKNPFAALVCHDGTYDSPQHMYESDVFFFGTTEFGKPAWEDRAVYEKHSPSHADGAGKWSTPQLTFHGLKDYRCARGQGIGIFTVLQRVGCPSRLVMFPDENHWVLNPYNSIEWYHDSLNWLKKYLSDAEVEATLARNAAMKSKSTEVASQKKVSNDWLPDEL
ncbi:putative peptidase S9 [Monocercomonoides exilis]|uniref:putative peptidase S9 n=1 Tax=Monocercomonoides exilis TaxID=2049356 RepID=UPI00355A616C|nr:putative peptidase S9 [Monocercomonoides exilis]|eukprot:MONOS_5662.1-p1 / transcript=MONOS_5662.1 / gene=MONOS_5662 / organism=Monocercomonoides_exilis_PA203 / gene_product=alpha / transcript_product=alpha / location=Mono_scaffold00167:85517-87985(+) / protein_length=737 / sequence_SO=supercontig / SO=protein_coding / is_pseudo=false